MPVMWNMGTTHRLTASALACPHSAEPTTLGISVRWVCMQPLGRPVVPEVYGSRARSSGRAVAGPGVKPAVRASRQRTVPSGSGQSRHSQSRMAGAGRSAGSISPAPDMSGIASVMCVARMQRSRCDGGSVALACSTMGARSAVVTTTLVTGSTM